MKDLFQQPQGRVVKGDGAPPPSDDLGFVEYAVAALVRASGKTEGEVRDDLRLDRGGFGGEVTGGDGYCFRYRQPVASFQGLYIAGMPTLSVHRLGRLYVSLQVPSGADFPSDGLACLAQNQFDAPAGAALLDLLAVNMADDGWRDLQDNPHLRAFGLGRRLWQRKHR